MSQSLQKSLLSLQFLSSLHKLDFQSELHRLLHGCGRLQRGEAGLEEANRGGGLEEADEDYLLFTYGRARD